MGCQEDKNLRRVFSAIYSMISSPSKIISDEPLLPEDVELAGC